jgi:hypothetical protein
MRRGKEKGPSCSRIMIFGGSLCASSGHSLSTTARISKCRFHWGAVTRPAPRSPICTAGAKTSVLAVLRNRSTTNLALGITLPDLLSASHHNAATPATCGQAMLVPLRACSPPRKFADIMPTPGALTSGKMFENGATSNKSFVRCSAPTEITPSAAAGNDAAIL